MTPQQFRRLALALPGATEGAHMGHADFRVGGKIFATLGNPDPKWAVLLLKPDQQALVVATAGDVFSPVPGGWGLKGSTRINLAAADRAAVESALKLAWEVRAPRQKPDRQAMARVFTRVRKAAKATRLPGIAEATSYGTPSLKVAGKFLMRMKDAETFVFSCGADEKAMLMEAAPSLYFETDHYVGYPLVLVRAAASDAELAVCVTRAWHAQAPQKLKAAHGGAALVKGSRERKPARTKRGD
jgi:hypothetical protein